MRTVSSTELKNRLGAYLKLVGKGETLIVIDRGKPVARIVPTDSTQGESKTLDQVLKEMEAKGHLRLGTRPFKRFKPVRTNGKAASQMIIEGRV
jgi:prevent-host-death family protein